MVKLPFQKAPAIAVAGAFSLLRRVRLQLCVAAVVVCLSGCSQDTVNLSSPADVYNNYCFACHDTGAAGAPRLAQTEFWQQASGDRERLYKNTLKGIRAMPKKGTCLSCTDEQLKRTVDWMLEQSPAQASQ